MAEANNKSKGVDASTHDADSEVGDGGGKQKRNYFLPETGQVVEAKTVEDAVSQADKNSKGTKG